MGNIEWSRAKPVLDRLLDAPAEELEARLAAECGDDAALLEHVRALLAAEREATGFLETPAELALPGRPARGRRIGPWKLGSMLGTGGMGSVWLAHRADGAYAQQVALKVTRIGHATPQLLARLERERALLALLQHPGIARLLDGGTTDDGAPYLVMEYVDGRPIDEHADAECLTVEERIRLFVDVLAAVEYAHDIGVVHRDLKPANVFVTPAGKTKLLDFGIGKLLGAEDDSAWAKLTVSGEQMLTPRYASPEQFDGRPVGPASDIYALGVLLYELVTGRWPYRSAPTSLADVERAIRFDAPLRASRALIAHARGRSMDRDEIARRRSTTPDKLQRTLAREIDWVVAKALAKEPHRRYASARDFLEDLRRCLDGRPVFARPDSRVYRARRFVVRNRLLVAATITVVLALSIGLGFSLHQYGRAVEAGYALSEEVARANTAEADARRRFEQVREIGRDLVFEIHDGIRLLPGSVGAQKLLLERGLAYLDSLDPDPVADGELAFDVADGYLRLAMLMDANSSANLGLRERAELAIARSEALFRALLEHAPDHAQARAGWVRSLRQRAELRTRSGELRDARRDCERALELVEAAPDKHVPVLRRAASSVFRWLAEVSLHEGSSRAALAFVERAEEAVEGLDEPGELQALYALRAQVQSELGQFAEAERNLRRALDMVAAAQLERPDEPTLAVARADVEAALGRMLLAAGRPAEARPLFEHARPVTRRLFDVDRSSRAAHDRIVDLERRLAQVALELGDTEGAAARFAEVLALIDDAQERWPTDARMAAERINTGSLLVQCWVTAGEFERAELAAREAIERTEALLEIQTEDATTRSNLGVLKGLLGHALLQLGRLDDARAVIEEYYAWSLEHEAFDVGGAWSRRNAMIAIDQMGGLHFELGKDERRPVEDRRSDLQRALELYRESAARAEDLMSQGILPATTRVNVDATEVDIAEAERLLAELGASG